MNIVGDAANEPSLAVDPTDPSRIVIGWRQFDSISSNFRQAGWSYTTNGGASWTASVIEPGVFRTDPVLEFDGAGRLYYQSLDGNFLNQVFASTDAGTSWGPGVQAYGGDKNWMTVDKSGGSGDGFVYGTWQRFFACCDPFTFTRSVDGGLFFQSPVQMPFFPSFGTLDVGPDGTVYSFGIDCSFGQDFDTFVLGKSIDAQNAGQTPSFTGVMVPMGGSMGIGTDPNPDGLLGQANVAVDPSNGDVYLVCSVNPPGADRADVHLVRSTNGGASFGAPIRINDDAPGASRWQWFAALDIAPSGRIDVIWNDTRNSGQANMSQLFYAWSIDHGATWHGNEPVSPMFNSHLGWPNQNKLGDYNEIESDDDGANVAWAATFNGEQDVYFLRLPADCRLSGPGAAFCSGDGTGSACPCANPGAPGHGCANGSASAGARLGACGSASVAAADLRLVGSGAVPSQAGLYFQGDAALNGGNGLPFRDGLRCAGGLVIRLETVTADADGSSQSSIDIAQKGGVAAGDTRHYQLWYRDPTGSPCGTGSNLSNGLTLVWQP
jgi:hypothetical protein